ncbi:MAG: (E)-4-hydroxy-3-methylbut-2-enyl-diphosphate synthase [Leptospirales bacterium]|jgi:(E)-4-hydroxy-3-methylbut-2-enyl-diphosphate synthase
MSGPSVKSTDRPAGRYLAASPFEYRRFASREVRVGQVGVGGANPIRLQSMTIADTMDTEATVAEAIELFEAGSEIVRITAPGPKDAENLRHIKTALLDRGYDFPLVADIHFSPKAALIAVEYVEKVRINPGNFADKKKFKTIEYSDAEYEDELERVRETFRPLLIRAKELGRAMRIGTNHGSLSDRIMNRFGDTPLGMVESALEFIHFARAENYHDIVVSMKASNPQVMVQAYRLLIERFYMEGLDYPLHLGVTEAGDGQDGRIKSAVGIGSLLDDGLGDTIRVSLTEDAIHEIPAARRIAAPYNERAPSDAVDARAPVANPDSLYTGSSAASGAGAADLARRFRETVNPCVYARFLSEAVQAGTTYLGSKHQHRIILPVAPATDESDGAFANRLAEYKTRGADACIVSHDAWPRIRSNGALVKSGPPLFYDLSGAARFETDALTRPEGVTAGPGDRGDENGFAQDLPLTDIVRHPATGGLRLSTRPGFAAAKIKTALAALGQHDQPRALFIHLRLASLRDIAVLRECFANSSGTASIFADARLAFSIECPGETTRATRALVAILAEMHKTDGRQLPPIVLTPGSDFERDLEDTLYSSAIHAGGLFLDGIGDALLLPIPRDSANARTQNQQTITPAGSDDLLNLSLDLLQGVRLRLSKTEFISCPSCGRTLFDLQTTTARIKAKTGHLKGVKIAVMGCIVNGPGEMADADFGYVGAAPGHIHLYKGKEIVKPNIPSNIADEELVKLLKDNGAWREPEVDAG